MNQFREQQPKRTCKKTYKNYGSFKPFLAEDFNHRCGYTDCPDYWFDGTKSFHIDHFKPKKKYPELETEYSNLVYSCSYVNGSKSDKDNPHFLDPCNYNFNEHFKRDMMGRIIPISSQALVMHNELKLYLTRYQVIWILDEIFQRLAKLHELEEAQSSSEIKDMIVELSRELINYFKYLKIEL